MPISMRSTKLLMQRTAPGRKISDDAARMLCIYLERRAEELTIHALRIHERENQIRAQIGERPKVILSMKHMKMAIDGKFHGSGDVGRVNSEH